jgi:integrase/recombinase XerD
MKRLPVAINEQEFEKLIRHTNKKTHKLAFLLGFGAGLRISEITALESRHINLKNKNINVEQGKGGKDRVVPLPKGFREEHLALLPIGLSGRALQIAFRSACRRSGLVLIKPGIHFHSLRHGFASHAVARGIPVHHIRTLLGHASIATTNIYLEMNPQEALKSYEKLF